MKLNVQLWGVNCIKLLHTRRLGLIDRWFLRYMSVCEALILIFIVLRSKVSHTVAKHLIRIILIKYEEEPRVLTALDHLTDNFVWVCLNITDDTISRVSSYLRKLRLDNLRLDRRGFGVQKLETILRSPIL